MSTFRRILAAIAAFIERYLAEPVHDVPALPPAPDGPDVDSPAVVVTDVTPGRDPVPAPKPDVPARLGPLFVADVSHWNGDVNWTAFWSDPRFVGVWIKATQGTRYPHVDYFTRNARSAIMAARSAGRLGWDAWIGGYHYLNFDGDGRKQADYAAKVAAPILELTVGRLRFMLDIERGDRGSPNYDDTGAEVTACARAFTERWLEITGHRPVMYGRGAWRDLKLKGLLGGQGLVNPRYGGPMPAMDAYGVTRAMTVGWQYTNGVTNGTPFPLHPLGVARCDTSVLLHEEKGRLAALADVQRLIGA